VTALFAGNDKMAVGAMHYLTRSGVDVPGRVSVIGFDDLRHAAFVTPTLTTVHLPLYEVGALACERLIERAHGKGERVAEKLPTHLVVRESTGMVNTGTGVPASAGVSPAQR
jgi:DNA-binding LacI/PurR family transcriptional regulator